MQVTKLIAVAAVLAAALLMAGCGGKGGAATPQAAFEKMQAAAKEKRWKDMYGTMTPQTQERMIGSMIMVPMMIWGMQEAFAGDDAEKKKAAQDKLKAFSDTLKTHGIDLDEKKEGDKPNVQNPDEMFKELLKNVKDRPALFEFVMKTLDELPDAKSNPMVDGKLEDLKESGDSATATVKTKQDETETSTAIEFKKIDGGWFVHMPDSAFKSGNQGSN